MLSIIYYLCIITVYWISFIFITGFTSKDMNQFNKDCICLIDCKCDVYTFSIVFGLLLGPSTYAVKLSALFYDTWFQVFAFWAGSIVGIFLGPLTFYEYIINHQNQWHKPEWKKVGS